MATSSIFANVVLTTNEEAKRLCDAYDEFEQRQKEIPVSKTLSKNPSSFAHIDRVLKRMEETKKLSW